MKVSLVIHKPHFNLTHYIKKITTICHSIIFSLNHSYNALITNNIN